ncbi:MAG: hypothetical protein AAGD96_22295 [Chloroflexota bacterium]
MFFRRGIFPLLLVGFLGLMLISGIRQASYRNAYYRGFQAGQAAEASSAAAGMSAEQAAALASDGAEAAPAASPHGHYGHHHHRHGLGFFGFLFYLFMFAFLFKVLRRLAWGRRGGWGRSGWRRNYYSNSGPWHPGFGGGNHRSPKRKKPAEKGPSDDFYEM